jgi:alpha-L-fucosidase
MTKPLFQPHPVPAIQDTETVAHRDVRVAWMNEARFGMFIHWGLYALLAGMWKGEPVGEGTGEWIMNYAKIPVAEYKALAGQFNPAMFDADSWVKLAAGAGMKYIVITAKHHDGFAMFQSHVDDFNIVDATPFKRDPLRELADACQRAEIKLGFYYSQDLDWTAPGGGSYRGYWDEAQQGSFARYLDTKAIPQIDELLTNYAPYPAVMWFDYPTQNMTPELASKIVVLLNRHPDLIWNNRLGGGYHGDTATPEQHIPPEGYPGKVWEACMTMNDTWGYKSDDHNFKSVEELLHNLIDIVSKGGNYLLNVGPDALGAIPQEEADRLLQVGRWLEVNGEAIYGCGPAAGSLATQSVASDASWRCTASGAKRFIHLFEWPQSPFTLSGLTADVPLAYLLADPTTPLAVSQIGDKVTVTLPAQAPDPIVSVLVLQLAESDSEGAEA